MTNTFIGYEVHWHEFSRGKRVDHCGSAYTDVAYAKARAIRLKQLRTSHDVHIREVYLDEQQFKVFGNNIPFE
jgi:hypothetical protein